MFRVVSEKWRYLTLSRMFVGVPRCRQGIVVKSVHLVWAHVIYFNCKVVADWGGRRWRPFDLLPLMQHECVCRYVSRSAVCSEMFNVISDACERACSMKQWRDLMMFRRHRGCMEIFTLVSELCSKRREFFCLFANPHEVWRCLRRKKRLNVVAD